MQSPPFSWTRIPSLRMELWHYEVRRSPPGACSLLLIKTEFKGGLFVYKYTAAILRIIVSRAVRINGYINQKSCLFKGKKGNL